MADTIKITMLNDQELIAKLRAKGPRIIAILTAKMNALMIQLESYIKANKLSGQVLQRRAGILSGSVHANPAALEGTNIVGSVEGAGGPAWYGRLFEEGGSRFYTIMAVKARALAFIAGDGTKVFVRPPHAVVHPPAPLRPFMAPSLEEKTEDIKAGLQQSLQDGLNE
jgi:hypothetical protein